MGNIEAKFNERIAKLNRIISVYTKTLKRYNRYDVLVGSKFIKVKFYKNGEKIGDFDYDEKEFPIKDLAKMIRSYKAKLATEFKNRHKK